MQTDLQAISANSQVTVAQLTAVRGNLQQIQSGATSQPSQASLLALTSDVQALNGQLPTAAQTTQLASDFAAVLQSEGITDQSLITQTTTDIEAAVSSMNITATNVSTIDTDMQAIQTDLASQSNSNAPTGRAYGHSGFPGGPMAVNFGGGSMAGGFGGGSMAGGFGGGSMASGFGGPMIWSLGGMAGGNSGGTTTGGATTGGTGAVAAGGSDDGTASSDLGNAPISLFGGPWNS